MDYRELDPTLRRGLKKIIENWEKLGSDSFDYDYDSLVEAGIFQLIEDLSNDRDDIETSVDNLHQRACEHVGYPIKKASIIRDKFVDLMYQDKLDSIYVRKLLKEFDAISCCIADWTSYPATLVQSLIAIKELEHHEDMSLDLYRDLLYITSIYLGYPNAYLQKITLEEDGYDYKANGFLSYEERKEVAEQRYYDHEFLQDYDSDTDIDPEVYGCSVKVRFPNGKTYKYNCRFDISEDEIVIVSGKMKGIKGTVVERMEKWEAADYMEEVLEIIV